MRRLKDIPENWTITNLGSLCTLIQYGLTAIANNDASGVLYLRISDLDNYGNAHLKEPKYVSKKVANIEKYGLIPGDILIARSGSIGRSFVYKGSDRPWVFASYLIRFRPNPELVDSEYLGFYLRSPYYWQEVENVSHTVAQPNINSKELASLRIPLASLPEQRRIVTIMRQADTLRQMGSDFNYKAEHLLPSLFEHMFGRPEQWTKTKRLGSLVKFIGGGTPSRQVKKYFTGDIPWATSKDMKSRYLDDTQEHVTEEAVENSATNLVPPNSILVVVKSKILMHSLPIGITTKAFCFGQDIKGLICNPNIVPQFIVAAMLSQTKHILSQARGANTEGLTLDILRAISIPDVSIEKQQEYQKRILVYDEFEKYSQSFAEKFENLSQNLLARIFSGELTASWREIRKDELQRLAVERDKVLGLRSEKARLIDFEEGRVTPEEMEVLRNALGNFAANLASLHSEMFSGMGQQLEIINKSMAQSLVSMSQNLITPFLESFRQSLQQSLQNIQLTLPEIRLPDEDEINRQIDLLPLPQDKRAIHDVLDVTSLRVLKLAYASPAYFTPEDLTFGGITSTHTSASLRVLDSLGFVRMVEIDGVLRYHLIDANTDAALKPDQLQQ